MKQSVLLSAVVLAVATGPMWAISIETTVTPANIKEQTNPPLEVTVHNVKGLEQFEVIVKGKAGDEARFLQDAYLRLRKDGRVIAECQVARTERKKDVVFSFSVSPDLLAGSTFQVAYIAHIKEKDNRGRERWVGMPSGNFLTFPLEDFVRSRPKR